MDQLFSFFGGQDNINMHEKRYQGWGTLMMIISVTCESHQPIPNKLIWRAYKGALLDFNHSPIRFDG